MHRRTFLTALPAAALLLKARPAAAEATALRPKLGLTTPSPDFGPIYIYSVVELQDPTVPGLNEALDREVEAAATDLGAFMARQHETNGWNPQARVPCAGPDPRFLGEPHPSPNTTRYFQPHHGGWMEFLSCAYFGPCRVGAVADGGRLPQGHRAVYFIYGNVQPTPPTFPTTAKAYKNLMEADYAAVRRRMLIELRLLQGPAR